MAKKKTYVAAPQVPQESQALYQAVMEVLSGHSSVSEAARRLNLSRNHFQTLMHRGLHGLVEQLQPQPPGRPPKPREQVELEERAKRLERENEQLKARVEAVDRLLGVAADFAKGRIRASRQLLTKPAATTEESSDEPSEPDGARRALVDEAARVKAAGLELQLVSRAAEVSPATLRRWRARAEANEPLVLKRGPRPATQVDSLEAEALVRAMNGHIGAAALAKCCDGLSRRAAGRLIGRVQTAMENERQAKLTRVLIEPGVMAGFDAMHFVDGFLLVSGDAGTPYRRALEPVSDYVGPLVAWVLDKDFSENGAPLVARLDRAKQHLTADVLAVLARHGVLPLHGPPRHPGFYGQLERMNREHRLFLGAGALIRAEVDRAKHAFNEVLPRRRLEWRTASEAWSTRKPLDVDRQVFRAEVDEMTAKLKETREAQAWCWGTAERLAIEAALKRRGLLRVERGGWC